MSEDYEGLCDSDFFYRSGKLDHWKGQYTRGSPKGPVTVSWNHVSASQVETYDKCPRLWYFKSIQKLSETQKGHQTLGEAFHLCMEKVPESGIWPDRGDVAASPEDWDKAIAMAKAALPLLPTPLPGKPLMREHGLRMDTYEGGPTFVGYIDLAIPTGVGWPSFLVPPTEAIIGDYKTTSDFRYMKTPAELADSVQMMSYAKWAITPGGLQDNPTDNVRLIHMYARTKAPFIRSAIRDSSAIVTPDEINIKWEKTLDTVREMEQVSSQTDANNVHAGGALNGHCDAYGGCSFRQQCGLAKSTGIKSLFQITKKPDTSESPMAGSPILEKIRAAQAKASAELAAKNPAASVTTPETPTVTPTAIVSTSPEVTQGTDDATKPDPSKIVKPVEAIQSAGANVPSLAERMKAVAGVVPPDAPSRAQEVITQPGEVVNDPLKAVEETSEENEDDESDVGETVVSSTPVAKKRGRPTNAEIAARKLAAGASTLTETAQQCDTAVIAPAAAVASAISQELERALKERDEAVKKAQELASHHDSLIAERNDARAKMHASGVAKPGLTLFVDCYPMKGERPVDFFDWIGPIAAQVAQQNSVGDYRQIDYKAKAFLAVAMRETIKEHGLPTSMAISTYAGGADIALEILTPIAKQVIKKQ